MRILSIVVTFYPDENLLQANIKTFIDYVDKVLIWENTPELQKYKYRFIFVDKVEYCGDGINSISHALNFAWKYAVKEGYDYLLIMDQDSLFEDFKCYLDKTVNNPDMPEGIWGPAISKDDLDMPKIEELCSVINSGTIVKTDLIDKIGGWNETFVIDGVDDEFCLRAKKKGIHAYRINDCFLKQRYGIPQEVSFCGKKGVLRNDPPERLYNIYKNFTILARTYPEAVTFRRDFVTLWIKVRIKWILFEKNRFRKLYAILRGLFDGMIFKIQRE